MPATATSSQTPAVPAKPVERTPAAGRAEAFIARWRGVTASELSISQSFITELCELRGAPRPTHGPHGPRLAHSEGPQHVSLHGQDAVVVVDADEFNRLQGVRTGELLIPALQASPHRRVEIEAPHAPMPVRVVKL